MKNTLHILCAILLICCALSTCKNKDKKNDKGSSDKDIKKVHNQNKDALLIVDFPIHIESAGDDANILVWVGNAKCNDLKSDEWILNTSVRNKNKSYEKIGHVMLKENKGSDSICVSIIVDRDGSGSRPDTLTKDDLYWGPQEFYLADKPRKTLSESDFKTYTETVKRENSNTPNPTKSDPEISPPQKVEPVATETQTQDYSGSYSFIFNKTTVNITQIDTNGTKKFLVKNGEIQQKNYGYVYGWYYTINKKIPSSNLYNITQSMSLPDKKFAHHFEENMPFTINNDGSFELNYTSPYGTSYTNVTDHLTIKGKFTHEKQAEGTYMHKEEILNSSISAKEWTGQFTMAKVETQ